MPFAPWVFFVMMPSLAMIIDRDQKRTIEMARRPMFPYPMASVATLLESLDVGQDTAQTGEEIAAQEDGARRRAGDFS